MHHILIETKGLEKRMALLHGEKLLECHMFRPEKSPKAGQIYKGKVQKVQPGMQAAFIDIGKERNGFIHRDELPGFQEMPKEQQKHASISQLLTQGQELLVQVIKEEAGDKGARLTGILSYTGDNLVYFPSGSYIGVSKKMAGDSRDRWREWGEEIRIGSEGMVLRTSCEKAGEKAVAEELDRLRLEHKRLITAAKEKKPPCLLKEEPFYVSFLKKWSSISSRVTVDDAEVLRSVQKLHAGDVQLHHGTMPLFEAWNIDNELKEASSPNVVLQNGASMVIEHTEAMTVIDVNSGMYTGKADRDQTVLQVNVAAANEIARQLRLRSIGGMIAIDFITMKSKDHQRAVEERMSVLMKEDPVTTVLHGFSAMGVFEMTRKKERPPIRDFLPHSRNLKSEEKEQEHLKAQFFSFDRFLLSLQYDEAEAIWIQLSPKLYHVISDMYGLYEPEWNKKHPWKLYLTVNEDEPYYSLRQKGTIDEMEARISKELG
ncbi:Rne/Rng family ribonuclease [Fictibacillus iocasae]|uniref:Rne/Rng family ribonuclease n=1 Tax=Fictibacillus iocasae TaxID=2715437 RepID=A0ABW2NT76_9BACL